MDSDDDEGLAFGGGRRSPTPPRRGRSGGRSRSPPGRGRGGDRGRRGEEGVPGASRSAGAGGSKGGQRQRTTGRALPKLNSIHKGTIASIQTYGAFVQLGDGSEFKDGLLHVSRLSAVGRVEKVEDVVAQGDPVWVKVVEVKEEEGKYSLDMRYVGQRDGEDKDPNNTHTDAGGSGRGRGGSEPIRIGAVQSTTCSRCGARGHGARECWATNGKQYTLVEEPPDEPSGQREKPRSDPPGQDPALVKEALRYYLKRKAGEASSSSSSSSSSDKKKKKKLKKKEKKAQKKAKKKEKKELKKLKKKQKKEAKAAAKESKAAADAKGGREATEAKEAKDDKEATSVKMAKDRGKGKDGDDSESSSSS